MYLLKENDLLYPGMLQLLKTRKICMNDSN